MTPGEIAGIIASIAGLVAAGGWIATLGLNQIQRRKLMAETDKAEIELSSVRGEFNAKTLFSTAGELIESLRQEVSRLSSRLVEAEKRIDQIETEREQTQLDERRCKRELSAALERITFLESKGL